MPINKEAINQLEMEPKIEQVKKQPAGLSKYEDVLMENNKILKKILRQYRWQTIFSGIKILLILVPLAFAYFYLPPLLNKVIGDYKSAMSTVGGINKEMNSVKNLNIFEQIKELGGVR